MFKRLVKALLNMKCLKKGKSNQTITANISK